MTTLNAMDLNVEHREYACALFASASDFIPWARVEAKAITFVKQTDEKLRKRYDSLRAEVAEKYNGGSFAFLPRPESLDFVSPLRDHTGVPDADRASGFRWYR
jgi:hypothetical protein